MQLRVAGSATNNAALAVQAIVANQSNSGSEIFVPRAGRIYTIYCRGYAGGITSGLSSATVKIPIITFYTSE